MNLADELRKLQELHVNGALTNAEFAAAKARVLAQDRVAPVGPTDPTIERQLAEIARQNEVAQLDRQWEIERESYLVSGRYGNRHIPSRGGSLVGGVVILLFGLFWTAMAFGITSGFGQFPGGPPGVGGLFSLFPLFGILFIVVGVGMSIYSFNKADQYHAAEQEYRERRSQLLSQESGDEDGEAGRWG